MRRWSTCLIAGALCLLAQSGRDGYRNAYRAWREADPSLELDAGSAGAALAARTAKAADLAAAYGAAHIAMLRDAADQQEQNLEWLRANTVQSLPDLATPSDANRFVNRETNAVNVTLGAFANDPDRGIQQLRQALEREQAALAALKTAVVDRQQAEDTALKSVFTAEQARAKTLEQYTPLSSALSQSADLMKQETAAWAVYYSKLADAARNAGEPPPGGPVSNISAPGLQPSLSGLAPAEPRPPSITPLPLSRYVGTWNYDAGLSFHGSEPESVDLTVHEENGHATGTFSARFKIPAGGAGDPVLRFEFSGDFLPTKNQTFTLRTAEGATGTIDLIPAGPFNELEVNFSTEVKPGKIHQGDLLLVKQ